MRRGCRRAAARQDAAVRACRRLRPELVDGWSTLTASRAAGRGDALDAAARWPRRSASAPALGAADLGGARAAAAPGAALQALQRPGLRREAARRRRALRRPAGACRGALGRREEPDPGARPHPAGPADEEGPGRHHDPRLQAPRHHHPVRRAQRARRHGHRPVHAAAPAPGVHPLPQRGSSATCRPASSIHADPRQLRRPQAPRRSSAGSQRHPRWTFHFTPTSASWLNAVEGFFAKLTKRASSAACSRSSSTSRPPSTATSPSKPQPKPFVWTADPERSSPPSSVGTKC